MSSSRTEYTPDVVSHPGETLDDLLLERGISPAALAKRIGCRPRAIRAFICGKASMTRHLARELERVLGTPAGFWINRQRRYDERAASSAAGER